MLDLAIFLFLVAFAAGLLGFTRIASGATAGIARTLCHVAVTIFLAVLVFGVLLGKSAY